ncbi:vacuolar aminopeptidase 1 [Vermiconidia calcicola]|uniref:Vacuolar aminopeptidase 1 n=1 Tax=Vermiconidia calcicola TaxID=1690605 RepID=A0ACC3NBA3_9PEZI|nr:vacuolar aminopeptidase 1 [Vermiconidia calcicola]
MSSAGLKHDVTKRHQQPSHLDINPAYDRNALEHEAKQAHRIILADMVRNVASMQNLQSSMSDLNFSSPHPRRPYQPLQSQMQDPAPQPQEPIQRLDARPSSVQLRGNDEYTKAYMNRIATGQATPEEHASFDKNINRMMHPAFKKTSSLPKKVGPPVEERRDVLMKKEMVELRYGLPGSTWERDHTPWLYERLSESTAAEDRLVHKMWEKHLDTRAIPLKENDAHTALEPDLFEAQRFPGATSSAAEVYCKPFCDFLTENPTVFHAVDSTKRQLKAMGWTELSERDAWDIKPSGRYYVDRNGSGLIAFVVGAKYEPGNGAAILAGHVDALTAKLKPVSEVPNKAGYLQLGVAPYAGGLNTTWWDRDLGIGGRVLVKEGDKIVTKLVNLNRPIARIPTLAPHFGAAAAGPFNQETQMVPIIGLDDADSSATESQPSEPFSKPSVLGGGQGPVGSFVRTQPKALVKAIGDELGLNASSYTDIVNWELELYDVQPATVGGLNKEFIYAGRIDDKLCSWAAMQALIESQQHDTRFSSIIKIVGWFDNEEIGSQLRQGAKSNFLPQTIERAVGSLSKHQPASDLIGRTYANSYILSSDVTHAVNPNFLSAYLENHAPHLNVGLCVAADSNGHMTTDAVSTAILQRCCERIGAKLQVFQIRNDSRSGGTVGPMLSSMTGIRAIDAGMAQLSMHSIRATTGSLDPGLGVLTFMGFLNGFEHVDREFRS